MADDEHPQPADPVGETPERHRADQEDHVRSHVQQRKPGRREVAAGLEHQIDETVPDREQAEHAGHRQQPAQPRISKVPPPKSRPRQGRPRHSRRHPEAHADTTLR